MPAVLTVASAQATPGDTYTIRWICFLIGARGNVSERTVEIGDPRDSAGSCHVTESVDMSREE